MKGDAGREIRREKMGRRQIVGRIALERIYRLFELAGVEFVRHPERSNRYVQLALKIGKRCNVPVPHELKRNYCKKCHAFLKEGANAKIRVSGGILKITCTGCGVTKKISAVRNGKKAGEKSKTNQDKKASGKRLQ